MLCCLLRCLLRCLLLAMCCQLQSKVMWQLLLPLLLHIIGTSVKQSILPHIARGCQVLVLHGASRLLQGVW